MVFRARTTPGRAATGEQVLAASLYMRINNDHVVTREARKDRAGVGLPIGVLREARCPPAHPTVLVPDTVGSDNRVRGFALGEYSSTGAMLSAMVPLAVS
jgi:hypothetical protein